MSWRRLAIYAATAIMTATTVAGCAGQSAEAERIAGPTETEVRNTDIGSFLTFTNRSAETIRLQATCAYESPLNKFDLMLKPGESVELKGHGTGNDISGVLTFPDNQQLPLYVHNPYVKEAYAQVGGHKWYGDSPNGDLIEGRRFIVDWKGKWRDANDDIWKEWSMAYVGSG